MALEFKSGELDMEDPVPIEDVLERQVKKSGNGAHVTCRKKHRNKRAIVLILEEDD